MRSFVLQLLSAWRAAGHTVGVDTYVRAMELWNKLPADTPPEQLKTWLAPLVVSDKEEQIAFYALFDRLLPGWLARERVRRRRWALGLLSTIVIMALGWGIYSAYQTDRNRVGQPINQTQTPQIQPGSITQQEEGANPNSTTPLPGPSTGYRYWDVWEIGGWLLLAMLFVAILWINRHHYRGLLQDTEAQRNLDTRATELKRGPNDRPPFTWQFRWAGGTDCYAEEDLAGITPRLRGRSAGEAWLLDAPKTVQATVRDAGRINFRYRQPTQPDEYLLLIDIRSENDHRARLFDAIFQHLRRNEVYIVRYFYRQDPRFCWSEHPQSAIALQDLHQRFPTHRLVMVGTGNALLGKTDGELAPWAAVFDGWRYRTLLSTRPPAQWGYEEQTLATRFRLAPATLRGLADWVDNAGVEENTDLNRWRKTTDEWAEPIALPDHLAPATFVTALRAEYTDFTPDGSDVRLFLWVAAVALSPVLHWDATRFFAEVVEQHDPRPNQPLFTPRALQQLCRLPWFTTGRMPDNARRGLLRWLQTEQPDLLDRLRAAWKQTLEQNLEYLRQQAQDQSQTPFEETTAYEQLRLTMLVNELALDDLRLQMPPGQRLQLERELHNLIQYTEPDIVALELLENAEAREATTTGIEQGEMPTSVELNVLLTDITKNLVFIKGSNFRMWGEESTEDIDKDEKHVHDVFLLDYYMSRTEVTNAQYAAFLNDYQNDKVKSGEYAGQEMIYEYQWGIKFPKGTIQLYEPCKGYENYPVVHVTWYGATEYCCWLSEKTGQQYRLPSEAEWEYAARGGVSWRDGFIYSGSNDIEEVAWYSDNSSHHTHPVAQKKPNQRGLYDMSGNVCEWCEDDWYGNDYNPPSDGKAWIGSSRRGPFRVHRGGSWRDRALHCHVTARDLGAPRYRSDTLGFRPVRSAL